MARAGSARSLVSERQFSRWAKTCSKDVPELLESASLLVPEETATENGITVRDIRDYLVHDEWEIAPGLPEELGDDRSLPLAFWEKLADAAE